MVCSVQRLLSSKSQARIGLVDWTMVNGKKLRKACRGVGVQVTTNQQRSL